MTSSETRSPQMSTVIGLRQRKVQVEQGLMGPVMFRGDEIQRYSIEERMLYYHVPGFSVAVIRSGAIDWVEAYGVRRDSSDELVERDTLFQAGSIAKPVTLIAVLKMHEKQEIDLDADIHQYLRRHVLPPGKQSKEHPVTLRNILDHHSGIRGGGFMGYSVDQPMPTDEEMLRGGGRSNSLAAEVIHVPGERLEYSGLAYTVAQIALEDVLHQQFGKIMEQWVLQPFRMRHSDFAQPLPLAKHDQAAHGHLLDGNPVAGGWRNHPEQAAAGLWTTSTDLARFMIEIYRAFRGSSTNSENSGFSHLIQEMMSHRRDQHIYGFRCEGARLSITHYGATLGYRAGMNIHLDTGDGMVFMANSDAGMELGREWLRSVAQVYAWEDYHPTTYTHAIHEPDTLQSWVGEYQFDRSLVVQIKYEDNPGTLVALFPNGDELVLVPVHRTKYDASLHMVHKESGVEFGFSQDRSTQTTTLQLYDQRGVQKSQLSAH